MPDDQKPLLTDILAQPQPNPTDVVATFGEYIQIGMFIRSDDVAKSFDRINFSVEQLESMVVMLGAAIDTYEKKPKIVHEYGRVRDYLRAKIERKNNPNSSNTDILKGYKRDK